MATRSPITKQKGEALFRKWKEEEKTRKKNAELVAKAGKVRDELLTRTCAQITLTSRPTKFCVPLEARHFFFHYEDKRLTVWHMQEADENDDDELDLMIDGVILTQEYEVESLMPFLLDFLSKNSVD